MYKNLYFYQNKDFFGSIKKNLSLNLRFLGENLLDH